MNTPAMLMENVAAAVNRKPLAREDARLLLEQGEQTRSSYCAGCGGICESAVAGQVPVCDVMRYLMYYHAYGERDRGRRLFAALPAAARRRITQVDYSRAERRCPNGLPIADLMGQAARVLA
jgi:predicted aldo/keto reductase-like oxidoreductase